MSEDPRIDTIRSMREERDILAKKRKDKISDIWPNTEKEKILKPLFLHEKRNFDGKLDNLRDL